MSHRKTLEALEPRTLLSAAVPPAPPTEPGIHVLGRTIYVIGGPGNDIISIAKAPNDTEGEERPTSIQLQLGPSLPVVRAHNFRRFILDGGAGNDFIRIEANVPSAFRPRALFILGGDGNDSITGSRFNDKIVAGAGDDLVVGFSGVDWIDGGAGNDRLDGGYGNDRIFGGDGDDVLTGGPGSDRMFGGLGNDTFRNNETDTERKASGSRDLLDGGGGIDTAENDPGDRRRLITG